MVQLIVAVGPDHAQELAADLEERTAGRWTGHLLIASLGDDKVSNNADIEAFAANYAVVPIIVMASMTSASLEVNPMVRRLTRDQVIQQVNQWLKQSGLSWRDNAEACRQKGTFTWMEWGKWRKQFELVDPDKGPRVAAAILAQLRIATSQEVASWFDGLEAVDHSVYYIGSDPHSGDHALVSMLASRIEGANVSDVQTMPVLPPNSKIRYYGDASWSGGEAERRISCLFTPCENKTHSLSKEDTLFIRMAFITDLGEEKLQEAIAQLHDQRKCNRTRVKISVPHGHRLEVDPSGRMKGLAFQNPDILKYVDPDDPSFMRAFCKRIGGRIAKGRELGTEDIASTIAFEFSLPRAMLPVLIFGGRPVKAADGTEFIWKPLMESKHVTKPARSNQEAHCVACALQPRKPQPEAASALPPQLPNVASLPAVPAASSTIQSS
ncbi:phosphoribosyltransferase-like protein [Noviherbaspirillum autotrophicum]|uniref:PRTase-CE domain-containing protein n=1 Tax=Noviherbaspirillum autotrophicum TaxID=709839 RepID=A0A0C2BNR5_9BURK|nr:hypothetical protein [Noviherbaspirillum autotrophicum]KIF82880.1 hypothetical protein TSA66_21910 [Noviherbaspirillum autotrophicum]